MADIHSKAIDISIVIVNYKVKEYIANLLHSVEKAKGKLTLQTIVVDNNSQDDSIVFLKKRFPWVTYIENKENVGFGKANNQGFEIAEGEYTLIINPDTLLSEETFEEMISHMKDNARCGACGCKILNPDGTFAPESKRSVPSIASSFYKVTGLTALFPESKIFGDYYLGWIPEDEVHAVPVLSGAFMFWRTSVLKKLGGFDERFFMYGEDIDLCYRIQETDYHIDYVPTTSIIHYKGESTRKGDLKYVRIFNKALYQFFEKHYSSKYSLFFRMFIFSAITLRAGITFVLNNLRLIGFITSDLVLLNISVIVGFLVRFNFSYEAVTNLQNLSYLWINILASGLYVLLGVSMDLFRSQVTSISNQLKALIGSYFGVAFITFFVRNLAFSRLALIYGLICALALMVITWVIQLNFSKGDTKATGKLKRARILLVGSTSETKSIKQKIHSRPDWNYEVVGIIGLGEDENSDYMGQLPQLGDMVRAYNIDQVFFALKSISYKEMLMHLPQLQKSRVLVKLIPDSMDFILGKSNVEYLESIPVVEVEFAHVKGLNPFLKRLMDIVLGLVVFVPLFAITVPSFILNVKKRTFENGIRLFRPISKHKWKNRMLLFWNVVIGKLSIVGAPLVNAYDQHYEYQKGLMGIVQLNADKIQSNTDSENYELYYLQNYTIWMDIDILLKSVFNGFSILANLENPSSKR